MWTSVLTWLGAVALCLTLFVAFLPWIVRAFFFLLLFPRYGFRVIGREYVPRRGPALLAVNHVTWIDGFILAAVCPRNGKVLVNASYINRPGLSWLARRAGNIAIPSSGPKAQRAAIEASRAALDRGELLAIFPEAQLSRNGFMGSFYRGIEVVLAGRDDVPVIPVYLDNLWGSIFSFSGARFFRKRPKGLRRFVNVVFGPPVPFPRTTFAIRQAVQEAGVTAYAIRRKADDRLETIDLSLPHLNHPDLGLLAVSMPDFDCPGIHQTGQKPGTVGQAAPGVALRVVNDASHLLGPDTEGRLHALVAGRDGWIDTGFRASIDRDGFVRLA
jgi:1-acyl-sn-glycerol-3-phosphate acyltransferase